MSTPEQQRQRRQVAAVLAGALVLGAGGITAGALLADTPCDDLLVAARDAGQAEIEVPLIVGAADATVDALERSKEVLDAGERLGLGPLRGALASAPDADLVPFEDGVFAVHDDDLRVVESGLVAVATGRQADAIRRATLVGDDGLGLIRTGAEGDDLVARYDEDLRLGACRELDEPGTVVHLDSGVAIVDRGGDVEAVRLDGGSLWRNAELLDAPATDAAVTGLQAIVANVDEVVAVDLRTGEENWRVTAAEFEAPLTDTPLLVAGDDLVVLGLEDGVGTIEGETGGDIGRASVPGIPAPADAAVATTDGVYVAAGTSIFLIEPSRMTLLADLPARVRPGAQVIDELGGAVLFATEAGVAVLEGETVRVEAAIPATAISVSDGYTAVTTDIGSGVTFLFGPVGATADTATDAS